MTEKFFLLLSSSYSFLDVDFYLSVDPLYSKNGIYFYRPKDFMGHNNNTKGHTFSSKALYLDVYLGEHVSCEWFVYQRILI